MNKELVQIVHHLHSLISRCVELRIAMIDKYYYRMVIVKCVQNIKDLLKMDVAVCKIHVLKDSI